MALDWLFASASLKLAEGSVDRRVKDLITFQCVPRCAHNRASVT